MNKLSMAALGRKSIDEFKKTQKKPIVIILDNVRSQHNIGSAFRTADAFLIESIFLCGITATPPNNEIHKTALGAEDSVNWRYFPNTEEALKELKEKNYTVISVEQVENGISLNDFHPLKDQKYAFIFGNEVKGVGQNIVDSSDLCIEIPQSGTKHSLNVSVSIGIVLWDITNKL
jgi:tRNA G18 (ribose-2'-O)-methylase SpoU